MASTSHCCFLPPRPLPPFELITGGGTIGEISNDLQSYPAPLLVEMGKVRGPGSLVLVRQQGIKKEIAENKGNSTYTCYLLKFTGSFDRESLSYGTEKRGDRDVSFPGYVCP